MSRRKNKRYSVELKLQAVQDYLSGRGSQREICKKYGILAKRTLEVWVMWCNGHKEFKKRRGARTEIYMTKGRKTTLEERIEIVEYYIEHSKDYPATIEKYKVSFRQIYSWVRKYEETGIDDFVTAEGEQSRLKK